MVKLKTCLRLGDILKGSKLRYCNGHSMRGSLDVRAARQWWVVEKMNNEPCFSLEYSACLPEPAYAIKRLDNERISEISSSDQNSSDLIS